VERTVTRSLPLLEPGSVLEVHLPVVEKKALTRLLPLWRYAVWIGAVFVLLTAWVTIRVDVQALREDLDKSGRAHREARIVNDRLRLELDSRRRAVAMEAAAAQLSLTEKVVVVALPSAGAP
jgi:hypothetical protein